MTDVIRRYGIFIAIIGLVIAGLLLWLLLSRDDLSKIPTKGVFVNAWRYIWRRP